MDIKTGLLAAVALLSLGTAAYAAPVTGQISFNGYAQAVGSLGMGSATGISFANGTGTSISGTSGTITSYGGEYGSFAALGSCGGGSCGTIKDIASFTSSAPISAFLTLTTNGPAVSFDLSGITNVVHNTPDDSISFKATGTINFAGYDPTAVTFYLSAQGDSLTSFSATALSADAVPEPASLAILGGSLVGLSLLRRKKA